MCRHFGYLGPNVPLADLIFRPAHSLATQAYAPIDMRSGGTVNVDGFGVGWYPEPDTRPTPEEADPPDGLSAVRPRKRTVRRYRRPVPIWQDLAFAELARETTSSAMVAAVRSATIGMPVSEGACAPFTDGHWLFSFNGRIIGWPDTAVGMAATLPVRDLLTLDAPTDAALLWSILRGRLSDPEAADPGTVLSALIAEVLAAAPSSRLNALLCDGRTIFATTVTHSLWSYRGRRAVIVASEPFDDDPKWRPMPDGQLVVADPDGVAISPLPIAEAAVGSDTESEINAHRR